MAVGTTALIMGGIAAGSQIYGAHKAASAAKDAAKTQTQAAKEADARHLQVMSPWIQTGQQAVGRLGELAGLGPMQGPAPQGGPQTATPRPMGAAELIAGRVAGTAPPKQGGGGMFGAIRGAAGGMRSGAMAPLGAVAGGMPANASGYVTLRGPDGSTRQFDPGDPMVEKALQMGAQRVG